MKEAFRTGLTLPQLLGMTLWQYNAWCEAYQLRIKDDLSLQLQAAYYNAYWNSKAKHKRSLKSVLRELLGSKKKKAPPLDVAAARQIFKQLEEIKNAQKCN